ncbi:response regulator [Alkalihalobacillus sp. LMS39]|uniref:response regulator n=1 Tax=Alkalihalobacillus sp. LMS39 TaxID=2924032 RepID=UPI001FB3F591|nr:response regulator [Alkalihalobacillus sp. LMS39]UOE95222.1 response regulator [Alkalihalobacillus sp. LMS39]
MINVLIVEDDPMVVEVNSGFLEKLPSFRLCGTATTAKEAHEKINDLKPNLILLDMYLPDGFGLEVIKSIRDQEMKCDVIMITAARDTETVHEVFRLGAIDYLVKPFRFERFKSAMEVYLKMWKKLNHSSTLNQADIDAFKLTTQADTYLPKGLSENTLRQVLLKLVEQNEPVTAEQLASILGMARVTVRRYLEYLEKTEKVQVEIQYGSVGRPSHYYRT